VIRYSDPPILLRDVIEDVGDVVGLLERNAPYTPLGGWYRPDADLEVPDSPMWFQNDWVHADLRFDLERLEDPGLIGALGAIYPEAVPMDRAPSIFDPA